MTGVEDIVQKLQSKNPPEIEFALKKIRKNYVKKYAKMKQLQQYSVLKLLVSFVDQPQFCSISLSIIADACVERAWVKKVIEYNGMKSLYRIITCVLNDDIINRACRALGNIAKYRIDVFFRINLVHLITNIISVFHSSNSQFCILTAVRTLRILGVNTRVRKVILQSNGITCIAKLLCSSDQKLVLNSIRALGKLTEFCSIDYADQFLQGQLLEDVINLYNQKNSDIKMYVIETLKNVSSLESARFHLIKAGGVSLFFKVATENNSIKFKKLALLGLCGCLNYKHMWFSYGPSECEGLKLLIEALSLNVFESIHITIITSLLPLAIQQETPDLLTNLELISVLILRLINFIKHHEPHNKSLVSMTLSNIEDSVLNDKNLERLAQNSLMNFDLKKCYFSTNSLESKNRSVSSAYTSSGTIHSDQLSNNAITIPTRTILSNNLKACSSNKPNIHNVQDSKVVSKPNFESAYCSTTNNEESLVNMLDDCHERIGCAPSSFMLKQTKENNVPVVKFNKQISDQEEKNFKRIKISPQLSQNSQNISIKHLKLPSIRNDESLKFDKLILSLLSRLTFHIKKKSNSPLASRSCFSTLMMYIHCISNADPKAEKILLEIIKTRYSFKKIIAHGFVSKLDELLIPVHDPKVCMHCSYVHSVHEKLTYALQNEAESKFGAGNLGHILNYYKNVYFSNSLYAVSKIIHLKTALYTVLIKAKGLDIICEILRNTFENASEDFITCLLRIYQHLNAANLEKCASRRCCISQFCSFGMSSQCIYDDDVFDVVFIVDEGVKVSASREKISQSSDYFRAFLNGYFCEKQQSVVAIHDISAETLTAIFHFLHGCSTQKLCPFLNKVPFKSLFELYSECEKFLLNDIKMIAQNLLCHFMLPQTAVKIYKFAKINDSALLIDAALNYFLCLNVSENVSINCFQNFLKLENDFHVIDEIRQKFRKHFN